LVRRRTSLKRIRPRRRRDPPFLASAAGCAPWAGAWHAPCSLSRIRRWSRRQVSA